MAATAIDGNMLADQRKICRIVVERQLFRVDFPAGGIMTIHAIGFISFPVGRRLGKKLHCKERYQD